MASTKDRNQTLLVSDTVRLKFFVVNGQGEPSDPFQVQKVEIYKLYAEDATTTNPLGRTLITTIDSDSIVKDDVGKYRVNLELSTGLFNQGVYQDEWYILFEEDSSVATAPMDFRIQPNTWFTDSAPVIHDFSFSIRPNRMAKGSKKYIEIKMTPDVPRGTDKQRYYENLAKAGSLYISIEQKCGNCLPKEKDLRLIVDHEAIEERDGCYGYYFLDTCELDCGIYDVWAEATLGPNTYISDKLPFQIY